MTGPRPLACAWALAASLTAAACAPEAHGFIETEGQWADGEVINFHAPAKVYRSRTGRVDLQARASNRQRFLGIRISYDESRVPTPGMYEVDPAAKGKLELYCQEPVADQKDALIYDVVEHEVNAGQIAIEHLLRMSGSQFAGTFKDVVLERNEQPILRLFQGRFQGQLK